MLCVTFSFLSHRMKKVKAVKLSKTSFDIHGKNINFGHQTVCKTNPKPDKITN